MADWYPDNYCLRYPFRCEVPYDGPPHYPDIPTIVVRDITALHLDLGRAGFWRKARDGALAEWGSSGLHLFTRELGGQEYRKGRITLGVVQTQDGTKGQADFGATVPEPDGTQEPWRGRAWAHVDPEWFELQYLARTLAPVRRVIAHEIGHLFGFGHGGIGCMSSSASASVNAEEIEVLREYWSL